MKKYYLLVAVAIIGACAWIYYGVGASEVYPKQMTAASFKPHVFQALQDISVIKVQVFYFVPKNKKPSDGWQEPLTAALKELQDFHALQFRGTSRIEYEIAATSTAGFESNLKYDTADTSEGNPAALLAIRDELISRGKANTNPMQKDGYHVTYIIYEGVGATGTTGYALLSKKFLTDRQYGTVASSLLAHEFYHTLGLVDDYDTATGEPYSGDIMGMARTMPLSQAYIKSEVLKQMGL
jgi:hypothetical protein